MASQIPGFPRFVFTVFEPISLSLGFLPAIFAPDWFVSEQIAIPSPSSWAAQCRLVTQQVGNCYFLAFLVAIAVLYSTTEVKVVRNYLVALAIADVSHIGLTLLALAEEGQGWPGAWNAMAWGNNGITVSLGAFPSFTG